MYPFSVRNFPRYGRGVICISIGDLTSKSVLFLFTLLGASKPHFEKIPVIVDPIKCKQTIHEGLLVILQSKSRGRVIDIDFVMFCVILKNKRYIFSYILLNYDENIIFDLFIIICYILSFF